VLESNNKHVQYRHRYSSMAKGGCAGVDRPSSSGF